jgi:glycosyltransferase A (GT-A) superfamily protein (DUF2064 family)
MASVRRILLFTREPRAEARAKRLPVKRGSRLFAGFLESWAAAARRLSAELLIVAPPRSVAALSRAVTGSGVTVECQRGQDFGERLDDAVRRALARDGSPVLVAGGDSPAPPLPVLDRAFDELERSGAALVLEPSPDGGVNLIGLSSRSIVPLASVPWNTPHVRSSRAAAASERGLAVHLLPEKHDIDHAGDVARAGEEARRSSAAWAPFRKLLAAALAPAAPRAAWAPPPVTAAVPARTPAARAPPR